jgi:type IV pilus assembly protein PilC
MPTFRCKLATTDGRVIEKTLIGDNRTALKEHLEREGHFVLDVHRVEQGFRFIRWRGSRRRIKSKDFITFNQELSVLIKAGLPVLSALDAIIEKIGESELADILREIRGDIASGASLSEAFGKFAHVFSNLYIANLHAGEKSADIPLALTRHISYLKKIEEIKQKVIAASIYPLILTVASFFALLFLLLYVVPTFTRTYFEAGTQLPGLTLLLVHFSSGIKSNSIYILFILLAIVASFLYIRRTEEGRMGLDRWKLGIPFLGNVYLHYSISKLARTLATVLRGGVPLVDSVRIASGSLNNKYLRRQFDGAISLLEQGEGFSETLSRSKIFPPLAVRMIDAGESAGSLEQVLDNMAEFYEEDVDSRLTILTSAIEPALMIIMGLLIGFVVLAMYMPIFQMAGTIS